MEYIQQKPPGIGDVLERRKGIGGYSRVVRGVVAVHAGHIVVSEYSYTYD